jgi:CspA family cold shock protein
VIETAGQATGGRETGTVLWFNEKKGFGFIKPDEAGADLFVHISDVAAAGLTGLQEGQKLSFRRDSHGDGRFYATELVLIDSDPSSA